MQWVTLSARVICTVPARQPPYRKAGPCSGGGVRVMSSSPSIVPGIDRDVYLVLDDFGRIGCAWRVTHVEETDFETVIIDLLEGQFSNPVRVIGFNTAEGWSRDVSEQVADELRQRCADEMREMPDFLQEFMERYARPDRDVQLP